MFKNLLSRVAPLFVVLATLSTAGCGKIEKGVTFCTSDRSACPTGMSCQDGKSFGRTDGEWICAAPQTIVPPTSCSMTCPANQVCALISGAQTCVANGVACMAASCPTGTTCSVQGSVLVCTSNGGGKCTSEAGCASGQTCNIGAGVCEWPTSGVTTPVTIKWILPAGLNVKRVVFRGSILGLAGSEWHDMCTLGLPSGNEKAIKVSGNTYYCTRNFPADMTRKLTINGYLEVGDLSVPLPSRITEQFAAYKLLGDDATRAGCTGDGCFRSYGTFQVTSDRIDEIWSTTTATGTPPTVYAALSNGLDGANYSRPY